MNDKLLMAIALVAVLVIAAAAYQLFFNTPIEPVLGDYHVHADFKVYLRGQALNFSLEKYMSEKPAANQSNSAGNESSTGKALSNFVHLHDGDGEVVHAHLPGITLGYFFRTLSMKFNSTCFVSDDNESYCSSSSETLKFLVNGKPNSQFGEYSPQDLDRILISFGNETTVQLQEQIDSVSDRACIPSGKCPERGTPGDESSCTTGGTGCAPEPAHP